MKHCDAQPVSTSCWYMEKLSHVATPMQLDLLRERSRDGKLC